MRNLFRGAAIGTVAVVFLVIGLVVASHLDLTPDSRAQTPGTPGAFWAEGRSVPPAVQAPSFADLAEKLGPAVVNISIATVVRGGQASSPFGPDFPFREFFGDEFSRRFFRDGGPSPRGFKQRSLGSGFIISRDGYIVTNNHVIDNADEIVVILSGGEEFRAKVVGKDAKTDLALLKIDPKRDLPACLLGDSDATRVGDWVMAIGNPFGLGHTVTAGIVSAKGRDLGAGAYDDFLQTDAPINPGNSGGPLFDTAGNVVGITTAIIPGGGGGIGFAIPVNLAKTVLAQLREKKKVVRAQLGVSIQPITPDLAESLGLDGRQGALVGEVVKDSPADKAGILRRDVIIALNGREVKNAHDLPAMVAYLPVGSEAKVEIIRDGKRETRKVRLSEMVDEESAAAVSSGEETPEKTTQEALGFTVSSITPEVARELGLKGKVKGVVVTDVAQGSPAADANLRPGDVIIELNMAETSDMKSFARALDKAKGKRVIPVVVSREGRTLFIPLRRD